MSKMAVICFYWQGDRWREKGAGNAKADDHTNHHETHLKRAGDIPHKLPSIYASNLLHGVRRFAAEPFDFICYTNEPLDVDEGIETRPFTAASPMGVIPRLYMFSEESGLFGRQVLCLDIDIVIVGSLAGIMGYRGQFCARSKFRPGFEHLLDGDVISFQAGPENEARFWTSFLDNKKWAEEMTLGRERYWFRHVAGDIADRFEAVAPGQIVSYKRHVLPGRSIPKNARIVSCHGVPRPHEINTNWRKKYWPY